MRFFVLCLNRIAEDPSVCAASVEQPSDRLRRVANCQLTQIHLIHQILLKDVCFSLLAVRIQWTLRLFVHLNACLSENFMVTLAGDFASDFCF